MTERQLDQNRLLKSERRFRDLVQSVADYAIFQLDKDGVVATWNRGAERVKGYATDEIIGRHFSTFYTEEDRAAGLPARTLVTAASEGRFEAEGWRVRSDGTRFWASVVVDPIRDDNGAVVGFAKVTRDITERMEAQRILRETQEQLAVSQRMEAVGQLSGGIAHDFNNLLTIIMGNLERARRDAQEPGRNTANLQRSIGAPDAAATLQVLEQPSNKIDLMLADVVVPGMNGRELSRRARELRPGLKVLFMSGYPRNVVVHHGRLDPDVQLIQKPVSLQNLTARIRDMLEVGST